MDRELDDLLSTETYEVAGGGLPRHDIVLYGAGRLGKMAYALLSRVNVDVVCLIDRNAERLAGTFPVPVLTPEQAAGRFARSTPIFDCVFKDTVFLAASVMAPMGFRNIHTINDLFASIPELHYGNGWHSGALTNEDTRGIGGVYEALADDESRSAYLGNLRWRLAREASKRSAARLMAEDDKYFNPLTRLAWLQDTNFIDAGSFDLFFTRQALDSARNPFAPASVLALEPDPASFAQCRTIAAGLPSAQRDKIDLSDLALAGEPGIVPFLCDNDLASRLLHEDSPRTSVIDCQATTLNDIGDGVQRFGYLKLHVEGEELACLKAGARFIAKHRPLINVNCSHNRDGLWKLAHFLTENTEDYNYFFRAYAHYGEGLSFYAIPA
jgi:hypothetical protein